MHIQNVHLAANLSERLSAVRETLMAIKRTKLKVSLPVGAELTQGSKDAIHHIILGDLVRQEADLSADLENLGIDTSPESFFHDLASAA